LNQSSVIFGFLAAAFLIFITMRGELSVYMGFLLASPAGGSITGSTTALTNQTTAVAQAVGQTISAAAIY